MFILTFDINFSAVIIRINEIGVIILLIGI